MSPPEKPKSTIPPRTGSPGQSGSACRGLARSAAHRRQSESIDLITAYLQTFLPTDKKVYLIFPWETVDLLPPEEQALFRKLRRPACRCWRALYGLGPTGFAFITSYQTWLLMNSWQRMPEAPALFYI